MFNVQPVIYKILWDTMFLIMHNVASKSIEINGKSMFTVRFWQFNVRSNVPSSVKTLQFASVSASYLNNMLLRTLAFVPWAHIGCGISYTINTFFLLYILWKYRNFTSLIYIVSKGSPLITPLISPSRNTFALLTQGISDLLILLVLICCLNYEYWLDDAQV